MEKIKVTRKTTESEMNVVLDFAPLKKDYRKYIKTPIPFLNHMIEHIAWRGEVNIDVDLKLDEFVKACDMEHARELQYACDEIIYKMCSAHGNMYAVIKAILKINEGLELGGVREPLPALVEDDMKIVEEAAEMIREAKKKYL